MNLSNWKEIPSLFANGKFKVRWFTSTGQKQDEWILGYSRRVGAERIITNGLTLPLSDCQLIARPIADLSDEEIIERTDAEPADQVKSQFAKHERSRLIRGAESGNLLFKDALALINVGSYPFSQSHFGDSVINANEIEGGVGVSESKDCNQVLEDAEERMKELRDSINYPEEANEDFDHYTRGLYRGFEYAISVIENMNQ